MNPKILALAVAMAAAQMLALDAYAQTPVSPEDKAAARAERKKEGAAASRGPQMGEGEPIPAAKPKATPEQRGVGRTERRNEGAEAAKEFQPGEGDPIPDAKAKVSKADRDAARKARRAETAKANKAGEIKSKGQSSY